MFQRKLHFFRKYFGYCHEANTNVFTILFAIKWAKCHSSSTIIERVILIGYAMYCSADVHCQQYDSWGKHGIAKQANSANNGARETVSSSLDGGENDEQNGINFVEIRKISFTQDAIFFRTGPFYRGYEIVQILSAKNRWNAPKDNVPLRLNKQY